MYFANEQQALNRLIKKYQSWSHDGPHLNGACSFNTISFGDTLGSHVSFDHHSEQAGVNYFRLNCAGGCGDQWTCDFCIRADGNVEVSSISVSTNDDIMDDIQHLTNRFCASKGGIRLLSAS